MLRDLPPVQLKFGNSVITESRVVKNLGLTMDRHLTFESHIDQLVAKCTGVLIALSHYKHVMPSFTVALVVNPRLTEGGGGEKRPALPTFLDRSKTAADIDAKLSVPSPASI